MLHLPRVGPAASGVAKKMKQVARSPTTRKVPDLDPGPRTSGSEILAGGLVVGAPLSSRRIASPKFPAPASFPTYNFRAWDLATGVAAKMRTGGPPPPRPDQNFTYPSLVSQV